MQRLDPAFEQSVNELQLPIPSISNAPSSSTAPASTQCRVESAADRLLSRVIIPQHFRPSNVTSMLMVKSIFFTCSVIALFALGCHFKVSDNYVAPAFAGVITITCILSRLMGRAADELIVAKSLHDRAKNFLNGVEGNQAAHTKLTNRYQQTINQLNETRNHREQLEEDHENSLIARLIQFRQQAIKICDRAVLNAPQVALPTTGC